MHFRNFLGAGALCYATASADCLTLRPDRVTCLECLALTGRYRRPAGPEGVGSRTEEPKRSTAIALAAT